MSDTLQKLKDALLPAAAKVGSNMGKLESLRNKMDLNKNGNLEFNEIVYGLMTLPQYIIIVISIVSALYTVWQTIAGWINEDFNSNAILLAVSITITGFVLFIGLRSSYITNISAIEKMRNEANTVITDQKNQITAFEKEVFDLNQLLTKESAKVSYFEWAFKFIKEVNPNLQCPNPLVPDEPAK